MCKRAATPPSAPTRPADENPFHKQNEAANELSQIHVESLDVVFFDLSIDSFSTGHHTRQVAAA